MGKSAAETVREIEDTRERLDAEIRELEGRMPKPAVWAKRVAGIAAGGGIAGTAFWFIVKRARNKKKQQRVVQRVQPVIQVLPDKAAKRVSDAIEDGSWKTWAAGVGAAWVLFRLAELRQLRRLNRSVVVSRA